MEHVLKWVLVLFTVSLIVLAGLVLALPLVMLQAYVISDLWGLFITPWVHVQVPMSLWTMAGILLTIRVVAQGIASKSKTKKKDEEDQKIWDDVLLPLFATVLATLFAWGTGHIFYWMST